MTQRRWEEFGPFTIFDVETTGMSPTRNRIVEIAAVRVERDGALSRYQSLVNPGCIIPPSVICVHHVTNEMVADAPTFTQVGYDFLDFARGSILVAHNARFDLSFLQESLARTGLPLWKGKTLDTLQLVRATFRNLPSYSLQNLRSTFHLEDTMDDMVAHRAGADVEWTRLLLAHTLSELLRREAMK